MIPGRSKNKYNTSVLCVTQHTPCVTVVAAATTTSTTATSSIVNTSE